jgi:hypothetical protein
MRDRFSAFYSELCLAVVLREIVSALKVSEVSVCSFVFVCWCIDTKATRLLNYIVLTAL